MATANTLIIQGRRILAGNGNIDVEAWKSDVKVCIERDEEKPEQLVFIIELLRQVEERESLAETTPN